MGGAGGWAARDRGRRGRVGGAGGAGAGSGASVLVAPALRGPAAVRVVDDPVERRGPGAGARRQFRLPERSKPTGRPRGAAVPDRPVVQPGGALGEGGEGDLRVGELDSVISVQPEVLPGERYPKFARVGPRPVEGGVPAIVLVGEGVDPRLPRSTPSRASRSAG